MKLVTFVLVSMLAASSGVAEEAQFKNLTPILVVEEIEPVLELWVDRLGFEKTVEVPDGDKLGFVILTDGSLEIMYQTKLSIDREVKSAGLPAAMGKAAGPSVLYIDVSNLAEIREKLQGFDILVPSRKTDYGAEELWLQGPGGNLIGFASSPGNESSTQ